jgi:hypothetical protein
MCNVVYTIRCHVIAIILTVSFCGVHYYVLSCLSHCSLRQIWNQSFTNVSLVASFVRIALVMNHLLMKSDSEGNDAPNHFQLTCRTMAGNIRTLSSLSPLCFPGPYFLVSLHSFFLFLLFSVLLFLLLVHEAEILNAQAPSRNPNYMNILLI